MTVDETWPHYYEPENKAQSHQWVGPGSLRPKKFKTNHLMSTFFGTHKALLCRTFYPREVQYWSVLRGCLNMNATGLIFRSA